MAFEKTIRRPKFVFGGSPCLATRRNINGLISDSKAPIRTP